MRGKNFIVANEGCIAAKEEKIFFLETPFTGWWHSLLPTQQKQKKYFTATRCSVAFYISLFLILFQQREGKQESNWRHP